MCIRDSYSEIPWIKAKIVWDGSSLGMNHFGPEMIRKGSLCYIGSSGVVYSPYSAELDVRFFNQEKTIGQAFIKALNEFREDWFTWDPFNWITRGDMVKVKALKEFSILGDPGLEKDPKIGNKQVATRVKCNRKWCDMEIVFRPEYEIAEALEKTIITNSSRHLMEMCKPIIAIERFDYYLPEKSEVVKYHVIRKTRRFRNLTLPVAIPLTNSGYSFANCTFDYSVYPEGFYRINITELPDGRRVLTVLVPVYQVLNGTVNRDFSLNGDVVVNREIVIKLKYTTPVEIVVNAEDKGENQTENVTVIVYNNIEDQVQGNVYVEVSDGNLSLRGEKNAVSYTHLTLPTN
mgnify:FL=1